MVSLAEKNLQRAKDLYDRVFNVGLTNDSFVVDGKRARIGVGFVAKADLELLGVSVQPDEVDYKGTPCYMLVEVENGPKRAVPLRQKHLDVEKSLTASSNGQIPWDVRLWEGIKMLQERGFIQSAEALLAE